MLYSQLERAEHYLDPLVEGAQLVGLPLARVPDFAPALVSLDRRSVPGRTGGGEAAARRGLRALRHRLARPPGLRAEESFRRLLHFPFIGVDHAERAFIAAAIHARYAGRPDAPWLSPAIDLLSPALRRRANSRPRDPARLSLFRRRAGVLASARLRIEADCVRLEVAAAARAPDSEVVGDRLQPARRRPRGEAQRNHRCQPQRSGGGANDIGRLRDQPPGVALAIGPAQNHFSAGGLIYANSANRGLGAQGGERESLHAAARQPHAELYMGLVEVGVGLLPGGGGCRRR